MVWERVATDDRVGDLFANCVSCRGRLSSRLPGWVARGGAYVFADPWDLVGSFVEAVRASGICDLCLVAVQAMADVLGSGRKQ